MHITDYTACCPGVTNVTLGDVETPNLSILIIETLEVINKPGLAANSDGEKAVALQGLYTLWYFAGVSLGILPPLPGQEKDIVPHLAIDWPIAESTSIKDGRLGYTNGTTLTWQVGVHVASYGEQRNLGLHIHAAPRKSVQCAVDRMWRRASQ